MSVACSRPRRVPGSFGQVPPEPPLPTFHFISSRGERVRRARQSDQFDLARRVSENKQAAAVRRRRRPQGTRQTWARKLPAGARAQGSLAIGRAAPPVVQMSGVFARSAPPWLSRIVLAEECELAARPYCERRRPGNNNWRSSVNNQANGIVICRPSQELVGARHPGVRPVWRRPAGANQIGRLVCTSLVPTSPRVPLPTTRTSRRTRTRRMPATGKRLVRRTARAPLK